MSIATHQIGLYEIGESVYVGANCVVKKGQHVVTGNRVALKIVFKKQLDGKGLCFLFQEADLMQQLSKYSVYQPHIIRLYEIINTATLFIIVMEDCPNGSIRDYLQRIECKARREKELQRLFKQLVFALDFCHSQNIFHRDVKCANILIDAHKNVKLSDFGLAIQCWSSQTIQNSWPGTPAYSAPELFLKQRYHPRAVDLWSLGVVLYELYFGARPFLGSTTEQIREAVISGRYILKKKMSPAVQRIISALLVARPTDRISLASLKLDPYLNQHPKTPSSSFTQDQKPLFYINEAMDSILHQMEAYNVDRETILKGLKVTPFGPISAVFNMIVSQKLYEAVQTRSKCGPQHGSPTRASSHSNLRATFKQELQNLACNSRRRFSLPNLKPHLDPSLVATPPEFTF